MMTALMSAALAGNREAVDTLLRPGADPDILDSDGRPALYCAFQAGDLVITERLAQITTKGEAVRHTGGTNQSQTGDCF